MSADQGTQEGSESGSRSQVPVTPDPSPTATKRALNAGYTLAASVILGCAIGYWLDDHYGTKPWWMVGLACLFIIAGMYHAIKDFQR